MPVRQSASLERHVEFSNVTLEYMKNDVYKTAKNGGDYAKFYSRYKDEYLTRLNRSIRSFEKIIAEHKAWIADPAIKLRNNPTQDIVEIYKLKWQQDIDRNLAYKAIIKGIKEDRKV